MIERNALAALDSMNAVEKSAIWSEESAWEESAIPPRPWLAMGYMLRGSVTVVVGPGGVSKSSLMVAWGVHLALGLPYHGMRPLGRYRVMIYNVEDDDAEQRRRLSGVLTSAGKEPKDIAGRIARVGPTSVGTLLQKTSDNILISTAALAALENEIADFRPDVLILDPLAELHTAEENDNTALRAVLARLRDLAKSYNMALVLLHHTHKGVLSPGDANAARGASSIVSAARVVLTTTGMTMDDAKAFGLRSGAERYYFRLDGAKGNYSTLTEAEWFERRTYVLANGDTVAVAVPWFPPVDGCTPEIRAKVEAGIAQGHVNGPWSPQMRRTPRSVKHPMADAGITTKRGQEDLLADLLRDGFEMVKFYGVDHKPVLGLRTPDRKPDGWRWVDDDRDATVMTKRKTQGGKLAAKSRGTGGENGPPPVAKPL